MSLFHECHCGKARSWPRPPKWLPHPPLYRKEKREEYAEVLVVTQPVALSSYGATTRYLGPLSRGESPILVAPDKKTAASSSAAVI